jgi:pSer/pThr/pTyr-binding forkhead associated (FHA) protein
VADTGSTNGTHINGVRIPYGEARPIKEGDVVAFGDVEVRLRKKNP